MRSNSLEPTNQRKTVYLFLRLGVWAGLLIIFLLLIWSTGRSGLSSLLSNYGASINQLDVATAAVNLSPDDPESHYLRGTVLEANNDLAGAISEYTRAAALRPDDYVLWLSLARARELNGESEAAIAAARKAIPLAPFYAEPHWQLGNILLRTGQRDEAFKELSLAGASNPILLPSIMDLAWQLSNGDPSYVMRSINPQTPDSSRGLGEYFAKRGAVAEAIAMFSVAGRDAEAVRARRRYVGELISQKKFKAAYQLWAMDEPTNANVLDGLNDPGFEHESNLDEPGFGWRTAGNVPSVKLSLDSAWPREGKSSLRVDFNGDSDPGTPIISQFLLIESKTRYQLRFAFRTEEIVSGGLPNLQIIDPRTNRAIGQSGALPRATDGWREVTVDFLSGEAIAGDGGAVQIRLQREPCGRSPCPIFGRLWLDRVTLQRL